MRETRFKFCTDAYGFPQRALYRGRIYVGGIIHMRPARDTYRAWFMSDDEGMEVGQYPTIEEARAALLAYSKEALKGRRE